MQAVQRSATIAAHDIRIIRTNPLPFAVLFGMPLVAIEFSKPLYGALLREQGYRGANGADYAVAALGVMFAFFSIGYVALSFFREYGWLTWDRLRATPVRMVEIVAGKVAPPLALAVLQQAFVMTAGVLLFGMSIRGSAFGLLLVGTAFAVCLVGFGCAVVSLCRTMSQVSVIQAVGSMAFAGLGGSLSPTSLLPGWAQRLSPMVPSYWAVNGYRAVILDGHGVAAVGRPVGVLLGMGIGFGAVAIIRFRSDRSIMAWT